MHFRKGIGILVVCLGLTQGLSAQGFLKKQALALDSAFHMKPKVFGGIDSRQSFISRRTVNIAGGKLGLNFNNRFRLAAGYYFLATPFYRNMISPTGDTLNVKLKFWYIALSGEYVFFQNKRWEFALPLYLGGGLDAFSDSTRGFILPLEISLNGTYRIFPWLGLGAGLGYRWMVLNNRKVPENFSNPIYVLGIRLYFGDLIREFRDKKPKLPRLPASAGFSGSAFR